MKEFSPVLVALLNNPRVRPPEAVHNYECKNWRVGKSHGPCTCGAKELNKAIADELRAAGVVL